ncbi:hypothetical protein DPMN_119456 [Dreissena polymorpha]|uniref:Uncharacterized protein n=1 Tax=Dreissena polymorpha TaxID=45954 RepID=A0A9D4GIV0_DREPO|nr:hypothetical protein DPMN_119456 [Dreissena polymorpha]
MSAIDEYVLVEDIPSDTFERQLDDDLPGRLELNVKRGVTSNVKLTLSENKRLNQYAPMYEVKSVNGQNVLRKLNTSPLKVCCYSFNVLFYYIKKRSS